MVVIAARIVIAKRGEVDEPAEMPFHTSQRAALEIGDDLLDLRPLTGFFAVAVLHFDALAGAGTRSEERRVGEEGRSRWSPYHLKKKKKRERSGRTRWACWDRRRIVIQCGCFVG